jgi:hypothetical protein
MKNYILLAVLISLSGCASLQYAGISKFDAVPIVDAKTGAVTCCEIHGVSGKEYAALNIAASRNADGVISLTVAESGTKAFEGQAISAGATQAAIDAAAKAAVAAALAPILPALVPAAGAALASPGLGAAAVGAGGVLGAQKLLAPASGQGLKSPAP